VTITALQRQVLYVDSSGEMTHFVNYDRISNQAVIQHFHAPVSLSVLMTVLFPQDAADMSSSFTQWKQSSRGH